MTLQLMLPCNSCLKRASCFPVSGPSLILRSPVVQWSGRTGSPAPVLKTKRLREYHRCRNMWSRRLPGNYCSPFSTAAAAASSKQQQQQQRHQAATSSKSSSYKSGNQRQQQTAAASSRAAAAAPFTPSHRLHPTNHVHTFNQPPLHGAAGSRTVGGEGGG